VHRQVILEPNPILEQRWDYQVKHDQLACDVRRLALQALDGVILCSDIAEIEYIYARAHKDVPSAVRRLMQPSSLGIEHKKSPNNLPIIFMHSDQLHDSERLRRVEATDGTAVDSEPDYWVLSSIPHPSP
jgi:hypothetical protein